MKNLLRNLILTRNELCDNDSTNAILNTLTVKQKTIYKGICQNLSESQIAKEVYQSSPSGRSFQWSKSAVIDAMVNSIPFINESNKFQKEKIKVFRTLTAIKICGLFTFRSIQVDLCNRVLPSCKKYDLWEDAHYICQFLSRYYARFNLDLKKSEKYFLESKNYIKLLRLESEFDWALSKVRFHFRKEGLKSDTEYISSISNELSNKVNDSSLRCKVNYYVIKYTEFYCKNEKENLIHVLNEAIDYLKSLDYENAVALAYFRTALVQVYTTYNMYVEAEEMLTTILPKNNIDNRNYIQYELFFKIKMYLKKFDEAENLFSFLAKSSRKFDDPDIKDRLMIYELYIRLIHKKEINFRRLRYRFNRINKEKEEVLIPFKIGEIAYMYLFDQDRLIDKLDALKQYAYRVFKNKKYRRTFLFIQAIEANIKNKPFDLELLSDSIQVSNSSLELIDYRHLLEFLFENNKTLTPNL